MKILLNITLLFLVSVSFSQTSFRKLFTGNGYDYGYSLAQAADSGYFVCGASSSFAAGSSQAFLLKTDKNGELVWSKDFGGSASEEARKIKIIQDYAVYMAGFTNSIGEGGFDNYIVKTDFDGNLLWEKSFGGANWEQILDFVVLPDSGLVTVGKTESVGAGNEDWQITRLNKDGDILWEVIQGYGQTDVANSCVFYNDSIYVGGYIYDEVNSKYKGRIDKYDIQGNLIWHTELDLEKQIKLTDICATPNDIRYCGTAWDQGSESTKDRFVGSIDFISGEMGYTEIKETPGSSEWTIITPSIDSTRIWMNVQTKNEIDPSPFDDGQDSYIFKFTNYFGYENFFYSNSTTGDDFTYDVIPTLDSSIALVGSKQNYSENGAGIIIVKLGPNLESPVGDEPVHENLLTLTENQLMTEGVSVYPNPITDFVNVEIKNQEVTYSLEIIDLRGKVVVEKIMNQTEILDLTNLTAGSYILNVYNKSMRKSVRLIKD